MADKIYRCILTKDISVLENHHFHSPDGDEARALVEFKTLISEGKCGEDFKVTVEYVRDDPPFKGWEKLTAEERYHMVSDTSIKNQSEYDEEKSFQEYINKQTGRSRCFQCWAIIKKVANRKE
jgi:hypothetical protein